MVMLIALFAACQGEPEVHAIYDAARPEHFFDLPFPSDALLDAQGYPDLSGFPVAQTPLAASVLGGWVSRLEQSVHGFGANTPAFFRFDGPVSFPATTQGEPTDPVLWVALDDGALSPLDLRFVADPHGDPFYGDNTLAVAPTLGHPPRPGVRYAAVVMASADVGAPTDFLVPDEVSAALDAAGVRGDVAVATVFTVLDSTGELRALAADVLPRLGAWGDVGFRRVTQLEYKQGLTPSGEEATLCIATFEGGDTSTTHLEAQAEGAESVTDLLSGPMAVYEGTLPVWNYQGLEDRPYMRPGLLHVQDIDRVTGWIDVVDGHPAREPEPEPMRIVLQLPKGTDGQPGDARGIVLFDHGTAGHAYNIVQRRSVADRGAELAAIYAEAGFATLSRDATLYGQRYPLIDQGYGGSLGFYNIVNAPAFRDNQRQTALDGYVLRRYVEQQLNADLPGGSIDVSHVRRQGHSLGSVTSNLGLAMAPQDYEGALLSGTGGVFIHYFLDTGLLQDIDPATIASLFPLFGVDQVPDPITTTSIFGAVLGLPEPAWEHIDRLHPAGMLFQWQMDGSDPMAVAADEDVPITAVISPGDWQTPDFTARALVQVMPRAQSEDCHALSAYDPHYCLWREDEGLQYVRDWLAAP